MADEPKRIGVSAAERDVRHRLSRLEGYADDYDVMLPLGVARALLRDLDMWRRWASNFEPRMTNGDPPRP